MDILKVTMTECSMKTMVLRNILYSFLFCFLIFNPSLLTTPFKSREHGGVVQNVEEYHKEVQCIKSALFHEARSEPEEGIRAVMSVIYNRKQAKGYPDTFCKVILEPKQFSYLNSGKIQVDKPVKPLQEKDREAYTKVAGIAHEAAVGAFQPVLEPSVLYYTKVGVKNRWTRRMKVVKIVQSHQFMKVHTFGADVTKKES